MTFGIRAIRSPGVFPQIFPKFPHESEIQVGGGSEKFVMEKVQSDLSELRKQGEDTSATIKLLYENLARLDQILDEMERRRAAQTPPTTPSDRILTMMSEPAVDADESAAAATGIEETWFGPTEDHGSATARVTFVPASPPAAATKASPTSQDVPAVPDAASYAAGDLPLVSPTKCSTYCATVCSPLASTRLWLEPVPPHPPDPTKRCVEFRQPAYYEGARYLAEHDDDRSEERRVGKECLL